MEISRSEKKRRMKQLESLVAELCAMSPIAIDQLPVNEEMRTLFREAAALKGGAKNRHVKYITKQLKAEPVDELYDFVSAKKGKTLQDRKEFHEIEYLRDALINEAIESHRVAVRDNEELEEDWPSSIAVEACRKYPGLDQKMLTRLAWLYAKTRNRKHSRELFRILRASQEQERLRSNSE